MVNILGHWLSRISVEVIRALPHPYSFFLLLPENFLFSFKKTSFFCRWWVTSFSLPESLFFRFLKNLFFLAGGELRAFPLPDRRTLQPQPRHLLRRCVCVCVYMYVTHTHLRMYIYNTYNIYIYTQTWPEGQVPGGGVQIAGGGAGGDEIEGGAGAEGIRFFF